jgi:NifU-like protein involved in Fe-S cluster formation
VNQRPTGDPEDPLGPQVRRLFASLRHAGEPSEDPARAGEANAVAATALRVVCGEAGREQLGTRVRFMLHLRGEQLVEVRYRAYGCPYTLAACEWLAQRLEGGERGSIGGPLDWAQQLAVPPARLGRLLVLEDALTAALAAADKMVTDS